MASEGDCMAVKAKEHKFHSIGFSLLFKKKNFMAQQVLWARAWMSQIMFTAQLPWDVTHRSLDTFSVCHVVAT